MIHSENTDNQDFTVSFPTVNQCWLMPERDNNNFNLRVLTELSGLTAEKMSANYCCTNTRVKRLDNRRIVNELNNGVGMISVSSGICKREWRIS